MWAYKKEDSDFKDYIEELIGEERIYPYSGGTKLTNFHNIIVNPPLTVCSGMPQLLGDEQN